MFISKSYQFSSQKKKTDAIIKSNRKPLKISILSINFIITHKNTLIFKRNDSILNNQTSCGILWVNVHYAKDIMKVCPVKLIYYISSNFLCFCIAFTGFEFKKCRESTTAIIVPF